ncbi:hypothetical protein EC988_004469 [Linderina pennispora]|nr:hypothetical protein EC988_004469 [Linderina pennispora]
MAVIIVTGQLTRVLALCMVGLYLLYAVTVVITTYYEHRLSDYFYGKAAIDVSENDEVPDVAIRLQHSPIAAPALVVSEPDDSLSLDHASLVHRGNDALTERAPSVAAESKEHDSEDDENPEQAFEEFLLYHRRSMLTAVELTDFMAALKAAREEARRQTLQAHNSMPMLGIHSGYLPAHTGDPAGAAESDGSDEYLETATPQAINCVDYSEFTTPTPTPPWSNYTMLPHTNILIERSPSHDSEMSVRPDSDSARSIRLAKSPILHLSPSVFRSEPNLLKKWIADQSAAQQAHAAVPPTPQIQIRPASANPPDRLVSRAASPEPCAPVEVEGPGQARRQDSGHSEQQQEQAVIPTIWVQPPTPLPPPRRKLHHPLDAADECPSSPKSASDRSSHSSSIASYTSSITSPHLSIVPHSFTRPSSNWSSVSARTSRGWRGRGIALLRCCIPTLRHWRADATVLRKFFIVYSAVPMLLLTLTVPVLTRPPPRPAKTSSQAVAPAFRMPATVDDDQSPMMEQAIQMGVQRQLQMPHSPKRTSSPDNRLPSHSESPACIPRRCSLPSDCPVLLQPDESARLLPEHSDLVSYGANNHQEHLELHSRHMSLVSNRSKFVGHSFPTGISPTQSFSAASGFSFETNMSQGMWLAAVDPHQIVWAKRVMRYVCIAMTAMFLYCMLCRAMPQLLVIMPRAIGCVGVSTFLLLSICTYEHWVPDSYVIRVLPCFFGFLSGLSWIYLIADEIVAITQTLGLVMDISEEILGLTLVGFGNSVGDLVTNVTLATMGYPTMALAACFGGPMVNILLGVGMAAVSAMSHRGSNGDAVEIRISSKSIMVSTACLLFNTLVYVVIVPRQQYRMTRAVGLAAMAVYFVGMTVNVYSEL